jgi:hypothetical protein
VPLSAPSGAGRTTWLPTVLKVVSVVCVLVGLLLLVPAVFYSYLNVNPPIAGEGDVYFGDGTGFVIGALFGVLAVAALAGGAAAAIFARRLRS